MQKTIDKPAGLMMNWGFNAGKGERYTIDLKGISTRQTSFIIKLESLKKGEKPLFQQTLTVGETVSEEEAKKFLADMVGDLDQSIVAETVLEKSIAIASLQASSYSS